jgi:hypothetical protein
LKEKLRQNESRKQKSRINIHNKNASKSSTLTQPMPILSHNYDLTGQVEADPPSGVNEVSKYDPQAIIEN